MKLLARHKLIFSLIFCAVIVGGWSLALLPVSAQDSGYDETGAKGLVQCGNRADDPCTVEDVFNIFIIATNLLIGLVALFTIYAIASAGWAMVTSQGKTEAVTAARKQITGAVMGLLLVFLAFMIVNVIVYFLVGAKSDVNIFSSPLQYIGLTSGSGSQPSANQAPTNSVTK